MTVHNPTSQSRYCPELVRHIEPFEVAETPEDFQKCEHCQCQVSEPEGLKEPEAEPDILK